MTIEIKEAPTSHAEGHVLNPSAASRPRMPPHIGEVSRTRCLMSMRNPGAWTGIIGLLVTSCIAAACLLNADVASAAEDVAHRAQIQPLSAAKSFTFLFVTLGPFKIIGPFSTITRAADVHLTRQIALWSTFYACLALLYVALFGESILDSYGIPLSVLALAAGIILFLVALTNILLQFRPPVPPDKEEKPSTPTLKLALTPIAFPTIVTPHGVAVFVVILGLSPNLQARLLICGMALAIMLLNMIVMLVAKRSPPVVGLALTILGAALGVTQVALGLQIIIGALRVSGIL